MERQGDDRTDLGRAELDRKYQADMARAKSQEERNAIDARYKQAMAGIAGRNADTASRNADTQAERNRLLEGEYKSKDWKRHQPAGSRQNPKNVSQAEWDATNEVLAENPQWRKMFGQESVDSGGNKTTTLGGLPEEADPETHLEWIRMKNEIRKRARKRLAGKVNQDISLDVDLPEDDDEEEEE